MQEKATIGLDLGTGNCCVASVQNGIVTVLPNSLGKKTTPSCVAFNESRSLVGYSAKEQASVNPTNTIYSIKSILGRTFKDPVTQNYNKFSSCNVIKDHGMPRIEVEYRKSTLRPHPELIAAMQILDMKQQAEREVGEVGGAVVSVPAYFGNSQREAIVAACQIAGLELLDLISEPTATALTYRENRGSISGQETILVVDMGAAKLDVSVIRVSEQEVRVLAVCGDDALGGDDLDQCLMKLLDDQFFATHGKRLLDNPRSRMKLKMVSEELKLKLTHLSYWKTLIDGILGDMNLDVHITRKEFESLFSSEFSDKLSRILTSVLSTAKLSKEMINQVLVVGGCTRVPFIQSSLRKYFDGKTLNRTVNVDECVATGAALLANAIRRGVKVREAGVIEMIPDPSLMDRSQFRKYLELIPSLKFEIYMAHEFENGKEERKKYTYTLGSFGVFKEDVFYVKPYDRNKTMHAKNLPHLVVSSGKDELRTLEKHRKNVEAAETASNDLEEYCYRLQGELESKEYSNHDLEVKNYIDEVLEWIDDQEEHALSEYEERKNKLSQLWDQMKVKFQKIKAAREKANASSHAKTGGGMAKATNQNTKLKEGSRGPERVGSREVKDADAEGKVDEVDHPKNRKSGNTNKSSEGSKADSKHAVNHQRKRGETSGDLEPASKMTNSSGKSDEACESPSSKLLSESVSSCLRSDSHDNDGEQSRIEAESTVVGIKKDISEIIKDFYEIKTDISEIKKDFTKVKKDISEVKKDISEVKKDISEIKTSLQTMERSDVDTNTKVAVIEAKMNMINMELCPKVNSMLHADDDTIVYGDHDLISSVSLTASMVSADSAIEDPPESPLSYVPQTHVRAGDSGGRRKRDGGVNSGVSSVVSKNVPKMNKEPKAESVPGKNGKGKKAESVPDTNGMKKKAVNVPDTNGKEKKAETVPEKNGTEKKAENLDKNSTNEASSPGRKSAPSNHVQVKSPSAGKPTAKGGSASGPSKQSRSGGHHGAVAAASGHGGSPQRSTSVDNPEVNDAVLKPEDFKFTPVRNCLRAIWEFVRIYFECVRIYLGIDEMTNIREAREKLEQRSESRQRNKNKKPRRRGGRRAAKEFSDGETEDDEEANNQNRSFFRRMCSIQ